MSRRRRKERPGPRTQAAKTAPGRNQQKGGGNIANPVLRKTDQERLRSLITARTRAAAGKEGNPSRAAETAVPNSGPQGGGNDGRDSRRRRRSGTAGEDPARTGGTR